MKRCVCFLVLIRAVNFLCAEGISAPKDEYALLLKDLESINTPGYKSFFNPALHRAERTPVFLQGSLVVTGDALNVALAGRGFFKLRLKNGAVGFTRAGNFTLSEENDNSVYEIITADGFSLYAPLFLTKDEVSVLADDTKFTITPKGELVFKLAGGDAVHHLNVVDVPVSNLTHYKNAVYITNNSSLKAEKQIEDYYVVWKVLEESNTDILAVLLRMRYLVSLNRLDAANVDVKKEALQTAILFFSSPFVFYQHKLIKLAAYIDWLNNTVNAKKDVEAFFLNSDAYSEFCFQEHQEYMQIKMGQSAFIETLLPYLTLD